MALGEDSSCRKHAAHVITRGRAGINTDDVRAELGCSGNVRGWRKCKVDGS